MNKIQAIKEYTDIRNHGFVRVALIAPRVYLADPDRNAKSHFQKINEVYKKGAQYVVAPELGLTGYSCGDLFHQQQLLIAAEEALEKLVRKTLKLNILISVGIPILVDGAVYNTAVTFKNGEILAVVPKTYLPEYREFYEERFFASAADKQREVITLMGQEVPFGNDIIIRSEMYPNFALHTEVCEDIWVPVPPSTRAALNGATVLANLSASNITIDKSKYRRQLVEHASAKNLAIHLYTAAGYGESSTDLAWDGDGFVSERGTTIALMERFSREGTHVVIDVDVDLVVQERVRQNSFRDNARDMKILGPVREVKISGPIGTEDAHVFQNILRDIEKNPFVPANDEKRNERAREIFMIQATSVARRLEQLPKNCRRLVVGVSGGQDSTHALLVAVHAMDLLGLSRKHVVALTMPGFGTTDRTKNNAHYLMKALGVTTKELPIINSVEMLFKIIGHDGTTEDLTFENSQAWTRKLFELSTASKEGGMVLGTGDLSELVVGWATMYGDHASHYNPNSGVPKTLISHLIDWTAREIYRDEPKVRKTLKSILDTPVSPELISAKDGVITQKTDEIVGPIELRDFFTFYMLRFGFSPRKILRLSEHAFSGIYDRGETLKWLRIFIDRFFKSQFKRSVLPDGPKVGLVCVSPRGDWRMPSDANSDAWLSSLNDL